MPSESLSVVPSLPSSIPSPSVSVSNGSVPLVDSSISDTPSLSSSGSIVSLIPSLSQSGPEVLATSLGSDPFAVS